MKTRQLVFNNQAVAEFVQQHFINVAASDVDYNNLPSEAKARGEYRFLKNSLSAARHGIHQGIYIVTPGGKYLQQANVGWPSPDPHKALVIMRKALAEYQKMPKSDRLAVKPLSESDRSLPRKFHPTPPAEWLKIRSSTRSYPFSDMELFDQRHPEYYKIDRLWLTAEATRSLLPETLAEGATRAIKGIALKHLIHDSHLMLGCRGWPEESIQTANLKVKIVARKNQFYHLRYHGKFDFDSHSKWNDAAYQGELLGKAVWDNNNKKFTQFKWVSLGKHNQRILRDNETKGTVHTTTVGSLLELDPRKPNDLNILPHSWEAYPKEMKNQILIPQNDR